MPVNSIVVTSVTPVAGVSPVVDGSVIVEPVDVRRTKMASPGRASGSESDTPTTVVTSSSSVDGPVNAVDGATLTAVSTIVATAVAQLITPRPVGALRLTVNVSSPSTSVSAATVTSAVCVPDVPAAHVSVPVADVKSVPAVAVAGVVVVYVTEMAAVDGRLSVADTNGYAPASSSALVATAQISGSSWSTIVTVVVVSPLRSAVSDSPAVSDSTTVNVSSASSRESAIAGRLIVIGPGEPAVHT